MTNSAFFQWTLEAQEGIESLKYEQTQATTDLGDQEVLVELRAASLNYRDIVITKVFPHLSSRIAVYFFVISQVSVIINTSISKWRNLATKA